MSETFLQKNKKDNNLSKSNKPLFNSKLFFDLDNTSNDNDTYESDNSLELKEIESKNNNEYFLLHELLEELDSSFQFTNEKEEKEEKKEKDDKKEEEKEEEKEKQREKNVRNINDFTNIYKNKKYQNFLPNKFSQIFNTLIYNNNYEFYPKNYIHKKSSKNDLINNKNKIEIKKKNFEERKGDWLCLYCNNLNFAFRTKCNRCKALKDEAVKKII